MLQGLEKPRLGREVQVDSLMTLASYLSSTEVRSNSSMKLREEA